MLTLEQLPVMNAAFAMRSGILASVAGQRLTRKDQLGTVHTYEYDRAGRVTDDRVTTLGSGVDGAVRRVTTTYDIRGLREKITTYDNATVGSGRVRQAHATARCHLERVTKLGRTNRNTTNTAAPKHLPWPSYPRGSAVKERGRTA